MEVVQASSTWNPGRGVRINLHKNGDRSGAPRLVVAHGKLVQFVHLLDLATTRLHAPGSIKRLYTVNGQPVTQLTQLRDGAHYVGVVSAEQFKTVAYVDEQKAKTVLKAKHSVRAPDTTARVGKVASRVYVPKTAKTIYVLPDGDGTKARKIVLTKRELLSFHTVLDLVGKRTQMPSGVRKLYTLGGEVVEDAERFVNGEAYVAVTRGGFKEAHDLGCLDELKAKAARARSGQRRDKENLEKILSVKRRSRKRSKPVADIKPEDLILCTESLLRYAAAVVQLMAPEDPLDTLRIWFPTEVDHDAIISHFQGAVYDSRNHQAAYTANTWKHFCRSQEEFVGLVVILGLLPRYVYRDQPKAVATDDLCIQLLRFGVDKGLIGHLAPTAQLVCCLALSRSENAADLELATKLSAAIPAGGANHWISAYKPLFPWLEDVILRFGRYPHRNEILKRSSSPPEDSFLMSDESTFVIRLSRKPERRATMFRKGTREELAVDKLASDLVWDMHVTPLAF